MLYAYLLAVELVEVEQNDITNKINYKVEQVIIATYINITCEQILT